ncbi:hypothetical protein RPE78_05585 [Thioclava litoralis]|uniref:WXG100 family type VII secretion target n=1 Tax=Thioclava litoralis TaxID=3076557 RepID=A0ABZ1E116_9RHOB|nr:hypothetical protein RPE78_05585 [Thioclava sp. FTW29]
MKTGPQSKLNRRIQANMDSLLASQLDSLESQLQSLSGAWTQSARSAFSTITRDTAGFERQTRQWLNRLNSETVETLNAVEERIEALQARSLRLDRLLTRHTLARVALVGGVMAALTLSGSFVAVTMMIAARQPPPTLQLQPPEALLGSRTIRGVGGLGELIVLPPGLVPTRCPLGAGAGRICLQREE